MAVFKNKHTTIRLSPTLLVKAEKDRPPKAFKLHYFKGKGLQSAVNLDSFSSLLDKMEDLDRATHETWSFSLGNFSKTLPKNSGHRKFDSRCLLGRASHRARLRMD